MQRLGSCQHRIEDRRSNKQHLIQQGCAVIRVDHQMREKQKQKDRDVDRNDPACQGGGDVAFVQDVFGSLRYLDIVEPAIGKTEKEDRI